MCVILSCRKSAEFTAELSIPYIDTTNYPVQGTFKTQGRANAPLDFVKGGKIISRGGGL